MNVLLIDDDANIRESFAMLFESLGHAVETSANGVISGGYVPDVVICDYDLGMQSHLNGVEIITSIRPFFPNARFIICSGLDRVVPEWAEFFSKTDVFNLVKSLDSSVEV